MKVKLSVLVCVAAVVGCTFDAAPASALISHFQPIGTPADARNDRPTRPGTWVQAHYGPYTVPANGQIHNQIDSVQAPCSNCYITDMVPALLNGTATAPGATPQNLNTDVMMHHFVLSNTARQDTTCPGVGPGLLGERFWGSGNERTHLHLPNGYGYQQGSNNWNLTTHVINKSASQKILWVEVTFRYVDIANPVRPIWLDIDGMVSTESGNASCADSEYTIPLGASDSHRTWQVPAGLNGRLVAITGHMHDVDITGPGSCIDHCAAAGHGLAVTAELLGASGPYYGPNPPTVACDEPPPPPASNDDRCSTIPHPTGTTICRAEGYYSTPFGGTAFRGHLDTVNLCGDFTSVPAGAQTQAYPPGGAWPGEFAISAGQQIRVHSEYQNDTGFQQTDAMGIMMGYLTTTNGYPRPKAATPTVVPLVHAYQACGSPNRVHATPLNFPSCNPPQRTSPLITSGTPDANSRVANFTGSAKFVVVGVEGGADDSDVNITVNVADVRNTDAGLSDYTGELELRPTLRITDRLNTPGERGTTQSIDFPVAVPCTATVDANIGGSCAIATSADAVQPGTVVESRRSNWEFDRVRVFDGGADADANTLPNNLFAVQGIFAP